MYLVFLSMTYSNVFHFVISNSMTVLLNTIHHKDKTDTASLFFNCNMIKTTTAGANADVITPPLVALPCKSTKMNFMHTYYNYQW